jgi:hypothetical protein
VVAPPLWQASNHYERDAVHGGAQAIGSPVCGVDGFEGWFFEPKINQ